MKVLITGTMGFIGSHTVDYFLNKGWTVFGIDNTPTNNLDHHKNN
ncbi:MAG: GDP-mannose 4,6-dehydratase, partial [Bacteriovoracaceae bacterium]